MSQRKESRRRFMKGAAIATAATVAAPAVVKAQGPISMRWQSTWPSKDIFHEYALDFAKRVNDMTGGELKIDVLPAGAVVPAFGMDANMLLAWHKYGGGQELLAKLYASIGITTGGVRPHGEGNG